MSVMQFTLNSDDGSLLFLKDEAIVGVGYNPDFPGCTIHTITKSWGVQEAYDEVIALEHVRTYRPDHNLWLSDVEVEQQKNPVQVPVDRRSEAKAALDHILNRGGHAGQ